MAEVKMKTFIIDGDNVKKLKNLQVAFTVDKHGLLTVVQIEAYDQMADSYQTLTLDTYSKSNLSKIEEICMDWYNNIYSQTA